MKKTTFILAMILFIAGTTTGCKSWSKGENSRAEKALLLQQKTDEAEWQNLKAETEYQLNENQKKIADIRVEIRKPGSKYDSYYEKQIDNLEIKNNNLRDRLHNYSRNRTNWNEFKVSFKNDMYTLGQAFKGFFK